MNLLVYLKLYAKRWQISRSDDPFSACVPIVWSIIVQSSSIIIIWACSDVPNFFDVFGAWKYILYGDKSHVYHTFLTIAGPSPIEAQINQVSKLISISLHHKSASSRTTGNKRCFSGHWSISGDDNLFSAWVPIVWSVIVQSSSIILSILSSCGVFGWQQVPVLPGMGRSSSGTRI